jgi:hypothetical protein
MQQHAFWQHLILRGPAADCNLERRCEPVSVGLARPRVAKTFCELARGGLNGSARPGGSSMGAGEETGTLEAMMRWRSVFNVGCQCCRHGDCATTLQERASQAEQLQRVVETTASSASETRMLGVLRYAGRRGAQQSLRRLLIWQQQRAISAALRGRYNSCNECLPLPYSASPYQ